MDFELTEHQLMCRDMARSFAERELDRAAKDCEGRRAHPRELIKKMGDLGLLATLIPRSYGGAGLDFLTHCIVSEQMCWGDLCLGMLVAGPSGTLSGSAILYGGTEEQKRTHLAQIAKGDKIFCMAAVEPEAGSDATAIQTGAAFDGSNWTITGTKAFITGGGIADVALVVAQTDKSKGIRGITLFIVPTNTQGYSSTEVHGKMGMHCADLAHINLTDCRIPSENRLGEIGQGMRIALQSINNARLSIAAGCVGGAQRCLDVSIDYARQRRQFGRPIGSFQLVQSVLADMATEIEAARYLTYRAANLKDKGKPHNKETSMAKYYASEMLVRVSADAVRLHGACGYTDDFPVERFHRDSLATTIFGGTSEIQKLTIGRELLDINALS